MLCSQCGGQLKDTANFCKYCGSKVSNNNSSESLKPNTQEVEGSTYENTESSLFDQAILADEKIRQVIPSDENEFIDPYLQDDETNKFDPITDEIIDILYSRERDVDIKTELKEILEEVEKIEQRLSIGLVSEVEAKSIIREKQELISALRSERKSLKKDKINIETLHDEIADLKDKLDKLHIMYNEGKISNESVYKKLKKEYTDSYNEKSKQYEQEVVNLKNWLDILALDVHKLKEEIDILTTKAGIGEIEQEDADSKIKLLEIDIYRKELAYQSLKDIQNRLNLA
jgi:hypothetical protein